MRLYYSNSSDDTSNESGFPFKTIAIFAFAILLVYTMLSGKDNSTARKTTTTYNTTVNNTSQSIVTTMSDLVAEARSISSNDASLNSLNGLGKVVIWDKTKDKEFTHSSLNRSLLWSMGDKKKYVVIIDRYDQTQVSTYTRRGSNGSGVRIPGMRKDAVLYVYDLSVKKCLGKRTIIGTNPPQNYSSKYTPQAIYGEIDGPIASWINDSFGSGNLSSSVQVPTVPQKSLANPYPSVPKVNNGAIASASHSSADVEGSYVHSARLAIDGNPSSCWSEGAPGLGIGESITISFNGTYEVNGMFIWPGHQKSNELFYQNARPTVITVVGSDGSRERCYISDRFGMQRINFSNSMKVNYIRLFIDQAKPGTKYADTCIAEVEFF